MKKIADLILDGVNSADTKLLITAIVVVVALAIGGMFLYSQQSKEAAKQKIPWVILGIIIVANAAYWGTYLVEKLTF